MAIYYWTSNEQKAYWADSLVSTVHGAWLTYAAARAVIKDPQLLRTANFHYTTKESTECCRIFLGYIMSDLAICAYWGKDFPGHIANYVHHISAIFTWSQYLLFQRGHTGALIGNLCEASTKLYVLNGVAILVLWFQFRVCLYGWAGIKMFQQRKGFLAQPSWQSGSQAACYSIGYALQVFWFSKIVKGALKVLGFGKKKNKKKLTDKGSGVESGKPIKSI